MRLLKNGNPVEINDEHAGKVLEMYPNTFQKLSEEGKSDSQKENEIIPEADLPKNSTEDSELGEVDENAGQTFTEEELKALSREELFSLAKDLGIPTVYNSKNETIIQKILISGN